MKTKKLFDILKLVGEIRSIKWDMVFDVVKEIPKAKIIYKKWNDEWKNKSEYTPLDLTKLKNWSTYDNAGCIDLRFSVEDNKLKCNARIYDGELLNGERVKLRFTAEFILPSKFIKTLEEDIIFELNCYLEDAYEEHLELQKKIWIEEFKKEIIG